MRPAFSVLLLTTLLGVGQGLFFAVYCIQVLEHFEVRAGPAGTLFYPLAAAISLAFLAAGLVASFFHLGRPERAWRSAAMWRTSWLSREVIVLPAFMGCVFLYGVGHWLGWQAQPVALGVDPTLALGAVATLLCLALFLCTGMIYACLKFLQEWHTPLTVINYLLFGCASGLMLATAYAAFVEPGLVHYLAAWAAGFTFAALVGRVASLLRNARLKPKSTLQTAIGVKHPRIVQKAQGAMGGSFNTREFFHGASGRFMRSVKWWFLVAVFPVPLALLGLGLGAGTPALLATAFLVQYVGLLAERWFFFAQANHPQNLYYQQIS
ncbi:MAG TPA: DmsC/YnfH family molybdoenzyme membrane anchor subunit [Burkholderiales bacterium]|nr:DmsC/YnfH family molybdoenzyme membrane anchor subunit [Burkholderiales bacterium]